MMRVQKSKEMQSVNSSLANTSQSVIGGQSVTQGGKSNKFVPSKQRTNSHLGERGGDPDL